MELLACALDDAVGYLNRGGEVAILDGTNVTKARRQLIIERLQKEVSMCVCHVASVVPLGWVGRSACLDSCVLIPYSSNPSLLFLHHRTGTRRCGSSPSARTRG